MGNAAIHENIDPLKVVLYTKCNMSLMDKIQTPLHFVQSEATSHTECTLTPSDHVPQKSGRKVQKCDFSHLNSPSFYKFSANQGHLHFCNVDYSKVCLCEVRMDSVQRLQCKVPYTDSIEAPVDPTKSNT